MPTQNPLTDLAGIWYSKVLLGDNSNIKSVI